MLQAEHCSECHACYVRSRASFECLPVVEVFLEEGISDTEVREPYLCLFTRCIHGMKFVTQAAAEQKGRFEVVRSRAAAEAIRDCRQNNCCWMSPVDLGRTMKPLTRTPG